VTEIIRTEPPSEPLTALVIIYVLVFFILFFGALTVLGLVLGWNPAWVSMWIGAMFFGMAAIVDIYRKNFLPDEMIVKTRIPKIVPRRQLRE
jgi:protein-S-isoprenylcysteine O-methyltransferase Ste14